MLRQRVITSIIMMIVLGAALALLPPILFGFFVAAVLLVAAWEWACLLKLATLAKSIYLAIFSALLLVMLFGYAPPLSVFIGSGLLWWLLALALVVCYPRGGQYWQATPVLLMLSVFVLLPGLAALITLRSLSGYVVYVLVFIALVAAADIGAYFTGRAFGKRKLAPLVSPNKTWEGFAGGMASTMLVGIGVFSQLPVLHEIPLYKVLLAVPGLALLAVFSVVGDLFESMLKRHCDAKDSSNLLPGHGGVLDRLDSISAALPVFVVILYFLELL